MGAFYVLAGLNHFRDPKFYLWLMPPYIPAHKQMVLWSGVAEVIIGVLVIVPQTRVVGAIGVFALLVAVFPVHIYMLQDREKFKKVPRWGLWLRVPIQFLLMAWALFYVF